MLLCVGFAGAHLEFWCSFLISRFGCYGIGAQAEGSLFFSEFQFSLMHLNRLSLTDYESEQKQVTNLRANSERGLYRLDNLLVRIHFIIVMISRTGLEP